nr:isoprenylcysteine carboxylmethyltransferase family protein [Mycobacterium noviomagense]
MRNAVAHVLFTLVAFGLLLFVPAGTFDYWQAWVFLGVVLATWIPCIYLLRTNPAMLRRRMRGGPVGEPRRAQQVIMVGLSLLLAAMFVVSSLDHRVGWSALPTAICLAGDVLVAVGLGVAVLVFVQNSYAAGVVRVETGQKLASTGLYELVRHPMYTGNAIAMVGVPLALGSYWGLVFVIPCLLILALRIRDEEKLLRDELDGYREYTEKVRYRLVPSVW